MLLFVNGVLFRSKDYLYYYIIIYYYITTHEGCVPTSVSFYAPPELSCDKINRNIPAPI